jgi:hypothetical protein
VPGENRARLFHKNMNPLRKHPYIRKTYSCLAATISPEKAEELLGSNTCNRPEIKNHTQELCEKMSAGKYVPMVADISFDTNGTLINGQHTLFAIRLCGKPQLICVKMGFDPKDIAVIDSGKPRSVGVRYALRNGRSLKQCRGDIQQSSYLCSVGRVMMISESGFGTGKINDDDLFEFVSKHEQIIQQVCPIRKDKRKGFKRSGFRAACADFFRKDPAEAKRFYDLVTSPDGTSIRDGAILKMRDYLESADSYGGEKRQVEDYQKTVFCIHKFRNKQPIQKIFAQKDWEF